ncbi:MAG: septum formation initiator family protein [Lachnospiraceae bacterium]|nr:septum formation initiator family protein [Lachnospiraceae bacterium]
MARFRKRPESGTGKVTVLLIVTTLVVVMTIQIASLYKKNLAYAAEQAELERSLEEATEERSRLEEFEEYTKTDDYIEDIAKSKLGLVHGNEIVFKEE